MLRSSNQKHTRLVNGAVVLMQSTRCAAEPQQPACSVWRLACRRGCVAAPQPLTGCGGMTGGRSRGGAYCEPHRVTAQASPECAAPGGGDCGIAFGGKRGDFCGVVRGVLFCDGKFGLASAAILHVVVKRLQVGRRKFRGASGSRAATWIRCVDCVRQGISKCRGRCV